MKKLSPDSTPASTPQPDRSRKLILYVEDEPDSYEITELQLSDRYEVLWARDDREACELVAKNHERLYAVLMDIQLKGSQLDGIKLTRALCGEALPDAPAYAKGLPALNAPIIFVTAGGERYGEEQLLAAGGSRVIKKPVDFVDLSLALACARARKIAEKYESPRRDPDAAHDELTGLYGYKRFCAVLASELTHASQLGRKLGLLLIDVDHLKAYNARCGRAQGDALLQQVTAILRSSADASQGRAWRSAPEIMGRHGGGELAILVPSADITAARARAESIRAAIEAHAFPGRERQPSKAVTVSAGVASFPQSATQQDQLVHAAERALRQAKLAGKNRVEIAKPIRDEERAALPDRSPDRSAGSRRARQGSAR